MQETADFRTGSHVPERRYATDAIGLGGSGRLPSLGEQLRQRIHGLRLVA